MVLVVDSLMDLVSPLLGDVGLTIGLINCPALAGATDVISAVADIVHLQGGRRKRCDERRRKRSLGCPLAPGGSSKDCISSTWRNRPWAQRAWARVNRLSILPRHLQARRGHCSG